jgi:hypothetical protein
MEKSIELLLKARLVIVFVVGIILFLTGLVVPEIHAGGVDIVVTHLYQRIILCILGALLAGIPIIVFVWERVQENRWEPKQREQYAESMKRDDLKAALEVHERSALKKLKSPDLKEASIGVQEVAALGADRPFKRGFNALAKELARRRDWSLRLAIVEALIVVAKPVRELY